MSIIVLFLIIMAIIDIGINLNSDKFIFGGIIISFIGYLGYIYYAQ